MKVKGSVLLARREFVEEHFGAQGWQRVLAAIPKDDRALLEGIVLSVGWFPFKAGERLDQAIVTVLASGDQQVFERIGRASAERNLSGAHRHFLKPGDPSGFLAQTAEIYRFYYDTGRRTCDATGETSAILTTHDADTFSRADCLTVIGWHKRALEMCGARDVQMHEEACRATGGPQCRYRVEWQL